MAHSSRSHRACGADGGWSVFGLVICGHRWSCWCPPWSSGSHRCHFRCPVPSSGVYNQRKEDRQFLSISSQYENSSKTLEFLWTSDSPDTDRVLTEGLLASFSWFLSFLVFLCPISVFISSRSASFVLRVAGPGLAAVIAVGHRGSVTHSLSSFSSLSSCL